MINGREQIMGEERTRKWKQQHRLGIQFNLLIPILVVRQDQPQIFPLATPGPLVPESKPSKPCNLIGGSRLIVIGALELRVCSWL